MRRGQDRMIVTGGFRRTLLWLVAGAFLCGGPRPAEERPWDVERAPVLVIGRAAAVPSETGVSLRVRIESVVRGPLTPGETITLRQVPHVDHAPRLEPGQRALLFLRRDGGWTFAGTDPSLKVLEDGINFTRLTRQVREIVGLPPPGTFGVSGPRRLRALARLTAAAERPAAAIALALLSREERLHERFTVEEKAALRERWNALPSRDPLVRPLTLVLTAAREEGMVPRLLEVIAGWTNSELKGMAPFVLVRLGYAETATRALEDRLDQDAVDRRAVIYALGVLGRPEVVPRLIRLLRDPDPHVQREAIAALGRIGDPAALPHLLQLAMGGEPPAFARQAMAALVQLDHPEAWRRLRALARHHPDPELRRFAARAIRDPFSVRD